MQGKHEQEEQMQDTPEKSLDERIQEFAEKVDSEGVADIQDAKPEEAPDQESFKQPSEAPEQEAHQVDQAEARSGEAEEPAQEVEEKPEAKVDYTYKAFGEVHEIPEEYRGLIRDEESKAKVARLMSSVAGVEGLKTQHKELEQQYQERSQEYERIVDDATRMYGLAQKGDIDTLLDLWGVDFKQKISFAKQMSEVYLNPQLQQQYNLHRQDRLAKMQYEQQVKQLERQTQTAEEQQSQWQEQQHDAYLRNRIASDQKLAQIEKLYNDHHGEDSFMTDLWEQGRYVAAKTGKPVDPEQMFKQLAKPYEPILAAQVQQAPQQPQAPTTQQSQTHQAQPKEKPIIPVAGKGQGHSPVRQNFKSLDDLEKYVEQEYGSKPF